MVTDALADAHECQVARPQVAIMRTSVQFIACLTVPLITSCSNPEPSVVFERQFITVGGHKLEVGRPAAEWEAVLGKGEWDLTSITWPQLRFAAFIERNACGQDYVTGGVVNLSSDPRVEVLPPLGGAVRLEHCLLTAETQLSGESLDCGTFLDFGTKVLRVGHPFDFGYQTVGGEFHQMVMFKENKKPTQVSHSLEAGHAEELGLSLGNDKPKVDHFIAEHGCERPPQLIYGWRALWRDLREAWVTLTSDDSE
jgi:hypothetical protein